MKKVALNKVVKIDRTVATDDDCLTLHYVGLEHVEKESGQFAEGFVPIPLNMLATNFRFTSKYVRDGKLRPYLNKVVLPNFPPSCRFPAPVRVFGDVWGAENKSQEMGCRNIWRICKTNKTNESPVIGTF